MSVIDLDKVDGIGIHNDGTLLAMLISDHLDWRNEYNHLTQLQKKINTYISFIESKQYEEIYPEQKFKSFQIEIHFQYEPIQICLKLIDTVNKQLQDKQIVVDFTIG